MATNTHVERMAVHKEAVVQFTVPQVPQLPDRFIRRFPELSDINAEWETWRNTLEAGLKQKLLEIREG